MAVLQKACICPFKAGRADLDNKFYVQFNPTEIAIEEAIGISGDPGEEYPEEQLFHYLWNGMGWQRPVRPRCGKNRLCLSVTLFFNTFTSLNQDSYKDVREYICQLYPYTNKSANYSDLTQICFLWGSIAVAGMLDKMSVHYTMFAPDGKPVRATVQLSIKGDYVGEEPGIGTEAGETGKKLHTASPDWKESFAGKENPRLKI